MKKYYVYYMTNPLTNKLFYIGKGTNASNRAKRWAGHISEARKWNNNCRWGNKQKLIILQNILNNNLLPICEIVFETDNEGDAYQREYDLIKIYGRLNNNSGILTNLMEGGSGSTTYTEEKRKILSERLSGEGNPMYGKHHTDETRNRISNTRKQKIKTGEIIPTKHTKEWKQKLRRDNAGGKATAKSVAQIDVHTGNIIKIWNSTRQAGLALNIKTWRNISQCCNKYKNRLCCKFYWRWENDPDIEQGKLINVDMLNMKRNGKPIIQTLNGIIIKTWISMGQIAKNYNVSASTITYTIKHKKLFNECYWEYA